MSENSSRFKVPKSPTRNIYQITKWLGCDFTSSPSAVDEYHSQDCVNMTRYMPGKIRKRMGYNLVSDMGDILPATNKSFHSIWKWNDNCYLFHVGSRIMYVKRNPTTKQFEFDILDRSIMPSYQSHKNVLYPFDNSVANVGSGERYFIKLNNYGLIVGSGHIGWIYEENDDFYYLSDTNIGAAYNAQLPFQIYIPTITISKSPTGGGKSYEAVNLLHQFFTESFYVSSSEATEKTFHLSYGLVNVKKVEVMNNSGSWEDIPALDPQETQVNYYYANYESGTVTFHIAPGASPVEGEDNVRITAISADLHYNFWPIRKCQFGISYGVGGNPDRIFLSGNPDYPNYDWCSEINDITYFPDLNYSVLGNDSTAIKGYAIVSNYLVTLKGEGTDPQTAIVRQGTLDSDGNAIFQVVKSLQGYPILSYKTSIMAGIEPLFLSKQGVMAITSDDISGDELMNNRSYFLDGKLMKESNLENAFAIRHNDFYLLFVNSHVYVLDTMQAITTDNVPYSIRQYASFYWDNIPATCAASVDGYVIFGTNDGTLMKSYTDPNSISSYSDYDTSINYPHKKAIYCKYETADLDALVFFKLKTYRYFALKVFSSVASSVKIYCYRNGEWELLKDDAGTVRYFTFSQLVFSKLTFRTDLGTRIVNSKVRLKKLDHAKFRIENDGLEESLMIDEFGIEFTQSGNFKN